MRIDIYLPKSSGFHIGIDEADIHSKYENLETSVFLANGNHTLYAADQAPTPSFVSKFFNFFNPLSYSTNDFSEEISFCIKKDLDVAIYIRYEECSKVSFVFDEELSEYLL